MSAVKFGGKRSRNVLHVRYYFATDVNANAHRDIVKDPSVPRVLYIARYLRALFEIGNSWIVSNTFEKLALSIPDHPIGASVGSLFEPGLFRLLSTACHSTFFNLPYLFLTVGVDDKVQRP